MERIKSLEPCYSRKHCNFYAIQIYYLSTDGEKPKPGYLTDSVAKEHQVEAN